MENMILKWRKSSYSSSQGDNCIELADLGDAVGVRDSKAPATGHLDVDRTDLCVLVAALKSE
ncbi:hypothetical protein GCM10009678_56720 [Actinomadura kijaniata]|uniref:DUF397 domain-containing protein n=1 Tax=Actinomadura namibiensis TaxID=182080 RepID=A0A7W3LL39_ACTNM|nr:DUF397 domain-containing protein [Actinomadura namibiensis]MBA8950109.1 hypothetical protein [Actinomadura namibiensis]